jgi:hypothetical protein
VLVDDAILFRRAELCEVENVVFTKGAVLTLVIYCDIIEKDFWTVCLSIAYEVKSAELITICAAI